MQIKQFRLSYIIVIILIGVLVFCLGFTSYSRRVPIKVYQVYIDGDKIGIVKDDKAFDLYINKKQEDIKKKYSYMLKKRATTFWETEKGWKDFDNAGSLCHGWSAIPVYYIIKFFEIS